MLCTRHFYNRTFHTNKFCSRTFSSWRNFPITIFGNQFMQIQQNRNALIPFKSQQPQYERYQFCSGKVGNVDHLPSIGNHMKLDTQFLSLDPYKRKNVKLQIQKGKSGNKYIEIVLEKNPTGQYFRFPNIPVPDDAYSFVRGLDELILELATENFEQKLNIQDTQSTMEIVNDDREATQSLKLKTIELPPGLHHKFQLELVVFPNKNKVKDQVQIFLGICAMNKRTMKKRFLTLPLHALPWLRNHMAEMLEKYDGTEEIEKEAPAQIPPKFITKIESRNGHIETKNLDNIQF